MAFLGKISAVLSANTQDFTRNIGTAKKELNDFAKRVSGVQLNLNTRALDGTLTKLQKFQRTIQEISKLQAGGTDLGIDPKKLNDQFKVFEDVGKPLTALVSKIEGLSNTLQAGLYPALGSIQKEFHDVYRAIQNGDPLEKFSDKVDALRGRLVALGRATAAAADIGKLSATLNADNTGASFAQPFAKAALQRSAQLRTQAEQLPANFRADGVFADLAVAAEANAARIEKAAARVLRVQLDIDEKGATTGRKQALVQAQTDLNRLTASQQGINAAFQRQIRSAQVQQIVSPKDTSAADALIAKLGSAVQQLRAVGGSSFQPLIASASRVAEQFVRGEASAARLRKAIEAVNAASNSLGSGRGLLDRTNSLLFSDTERDRQRIIGNFDRQRAQVPDGNASAVRRLEITRDSQLSRVALNNDVIPRVRAMQQQAAEVGDSNLQKRADELTKYSREISKALRDAERSAGSGNVKAADEAYARANKLIGEQSLKVRELTKDIETLNEARRQQRLFLEASGARGEQLSQGARDAAADLSTARQFRGQIASGESRIAIQGEIDRVTRSVVALQQKFAEVAASDLGSKQKAAELDRLDNEIRQSTAGLAAFIAQLSGGAFNTDQIQKAMEMARNSAGSISARSAQVAQLAFQQALFAIDDLISSTGGLEYKLRAVGNNITQLGLLLGQSGVIPGLTATTGLFIGLSAVIGGQAVSAILRWATGADAADAKTQQLNDSLSRQKSLAEGLAQAFDSLGQSIASRGFSEPAKRAAEFARQMENVRTKQKELREERLAESDPVVQEERSRQGVLQKQIAGESNIGRRIALAEQLRASREAERRRISEVAAQRAPQRRQVAGPVLESIRSTEFLVGGRLALRSEREAAARRDRALQEINAAPTSRALAEIIRSRIAERVPTAARPLTALAFEDNPEIMRAREDVANLKRLLDVIDVQVVQEAIDELSNAIVESSQSAAIVIDSAQQDVADAILRGVPGAAAFQATLDATSKQLESALKKLEDAQKLPAGEREAAVKQAQAQVNDIRQRRGAIAEEARSLRLSRGFGGERATEALSAISGLSQFANESAGIIAQLTGGVDAEKEARAKLNVAIVDNDEAARAAAQAQLEAIQKTNDLAAAMAEAAIAIEESVSPLRKVIGDTVAESERLVADTQQRFTENPTDANRQFRNLAQSQLIEDQRIAAERQNAISRARSEATANPEVARLSAEIEAVRQQRKSLAEAAAKNNVTPDQARMEQLANKEVGLNSKREQSIAKLMAAEGKLADAFSREVLARRRSLEFAQEVENRRQVRGNAMSGLDLLEGAAKRAGRELVQGIADIGEAVKELNKPLREGRPNADQINEIRRNEAAGRAAEEEFRRDFLQRNAPAVAQLQDNVINAVLQGPSRAALTSADVGTMDGARELNRLLRGDDPAKDANLLELQKQTKLLQDIAKDKPKVAV